jgi:lysozyme
MEALKRRLRRLLRKVARVRRQIRAAKNAPRELDEAGVAWIAEWEGLPNVKNDGRAYPYNDPVGYATIGYGHLIAYKPVSQLTPSERKPWKNGLTKADALALLRKDLREYSEAVADSTDISLNRNQLTALTSFTMNNGIGAWLSSTLRRKINDKRPSWEIRSEFSKWVNAGSPPRPLPGLVRRRKGEADLFFQKF